MSGKISCVSQHCFVCKLDGITYKKWQIRLLDALDISLRPGHTNASCLTLMKTVISDE